LKLVKLDYQKVQIGLQAGIGFLVRVRAYSRSENPDPIHNNISNHNSKANTGRKLNNTIEKILGHVSEYVSRERGATFLISIGKFDQKSNFQPRLAKVLSLIRAE